MYVLLELYQTSVYRTPWSTDDEQLGTNLARNTTDDDQIFNLQHHIKFQVSTVLTSIVFARIRTFEMFIPCHFVAGVPPI